MISTHKFRFSVEDPWQMGSDTSAEPDSFKA